MAKNDFEYGRWNSYTLQCGTIVTLISPDDCTLQCGMWLWNRDSEFTKWQHPTMWYVALGWHASELWIHPNVRHIGILHLVLISTTSPLSICHSAPVSKVLSKSDHPRQKKMTSCWFSRWRISAILDFKDPIMDALKTQLQLTKLLSFQKITFLHFGITIQDGGCPPCWILGVP